MDNKNGVYKTFFLTALQEEGIPTLIYLINGIKLQGKIDSFDQETVLLKIR